MPSLFDSILTRVDAVVLDTMGVSITLTPMRRVSPNVSTVSPDPGRAETVLTGVFHAEASELDAGGGNSYDPRLDRRLSRVGSRLAVSIRRSDLAYEPAAGDRIVRADDGRGYTVAEVNRDGSDLLSLTLNEI